MKRIISICLLGLLFLVGACANQTLVRHRNNYAQTLKHSNRIALLPPKAEVNMLSAVGDKTRMYDYEYEVEKVIFIALKPILRNKGYNVVRITKSHLKDKNIFSNYEILHDELSEETSSLYAAPMMDVDKASNIDNKVGHHALVIGKETKSNVLFLVNYLNEVQTNGARAMSFVMDAFFNTRSTEEVDKATILISMVDAKTGNILWSNYFFVSQDLFSDMFKGDEKDIDNKRINTLLENALKQLPNKKELVDKIADAS